jgi:hypothetical protein
MNENETANPDRDGGDLLTADFGTLRAPSESDAERPRPRRCSGRFGWRSYPMEMS